MTRSNEGYHDAVELAREAIQSLNRSERGDREVAGALGALAEALRDSQSGEKDSGGTIGKLAVTLLVFVASGLAGYTALEQHRAISEDNEINAKIAVMMAKSDVESERNIANAGVMSGLQTDVSELKTKTSEALNELRAHASDGHPHTVIRSVEALEDRVSRTEDRFNTQLTTLRKEFNDDVGDLREASRSERELLIVRFNEGLTSIREVLQSKWDMLSQVMSQHIAANNKCQDTADKK